MVDAPITVNDQLTLSDQLRIFRTVLDAIPHPVFIKDLRGFFLGCNRSLASLLEMTENQIIGRQAADLLPESMVRMAQQSDAELLRDQAKVTYETEFKGASGPERHLIVTKALCADNNGYPVGIVGMWLDITEKLMLEQELRQSQKMASIGQLAAGVAHEINNPTGYVSSNMETLDVYQGDLGRLIAGYRKLKEACKGAMARQTDPSIQNQIALVEQLEEEIELDFILEDVKDLIFESREGMRRIKKIVEDLKTFAHPGQNKVQDTDINQCIETTLSIVNNELKYKAEVTKDLGCLPIIAANPQQLNQVIANILVNAAQAINERGKIHIRTRHTNNHVSIDIRDTGCGMSPECLEKIFDPFFTTKEVGKGTGLGMNITYNIIKKHGGQIHVQSRVGEGTCFTILLPVNGNGSEVVAHELPSLQGSELPKPGSLSSSESKSKAM